MDPNLSAEEQEFSQAFNEGEAPPAPQEAASPAAPAHEPAAVDAAMVEDATNDDTTEAAAPPVNALVLESERESDPDEPTDPKDVQRAKSWEGRLRAREAEIAAREKALQERERATAPAEGDEDAAAAEAVEDRVEEVAAAVQDGSMTHAQAMAVLTRDFGGEFAGTLTTLMRDIAAEAAEQAAGSRIAALDERLGKADGAVASLIADLTDERQRRHFEAIADVHPDFTEVAEGEMMKAYLDSLNQADRQQADKVIAAGSARDIIKLLDAVKKSAKAPEEDPAVAAAAEDAEGVRSRGLRLPEPPKVAEGYEEAWNSF